MDSLKISRTKRDLIGFLLETGERCDLNELAPLTDANQTTDSQPVLAELRKKFIKKGDLSAVSKLSAYLNMEISAEELKTIIKSCWEKHDVETALEAIKLLLAGSPFVGRDSIENALRICLSRAKTADLFYRPRYAEIIPKIMELAAI